MLRAFGDSGLHYYTLAFLPVLEIKGSQRAYAKVEKLLINQNE